MEYFFNQSTTSDPALNVETNFHVQTLLGRIRITMQLQTQESCLLAKNMRAYLNFSIINHNNKGKDIEWLLLVIFDVQ